MKNSNYWNGVRPKVNIDLSDGNPDSCIFPYFSEMGNFNQWFIDDIVEQKFDLSELVKEYDEE